MQIVSAHSIMSLVSAACTGFKGTNKSTMNNNQESYRGATTSWSPPPSDGN